MTIEIDSISIEHAVAAFSQAMAEAGYREHVIQADGQRYNFSLLDSLTDGVVRGFRNGSLPIFVEENVAASEPPMEENAGASEPTGARENEEKQPRCLAAALAYAARGWAVFPADISDGQKKSHKAAAYSNGAKWGMTRKPDQIKLDFTRWPDAVGLPTGIENLIFVVEADTLKGHNVDGIASMRALEGEHGKLPDTLTAESPTASIHRYFKHPGNGIKIKNSTSEIAPGVDVRGDGGMVIAPPSVRADGTYRWLNNLPIAEAPNWLIDLVKEQPRTRAVPNAEIRLEGNGTASSEVMAALAVIDPDINRTAWFAIGCALFKALGDEAGFEAWNEWSFKGQKYPGQREMTVQWQSIAAKDGYGWSAGTIYYHANEADLGWASGRLPVPRTSPSFSPN
jgi:hypothetical protein